MYYRYRAIINNSEDKYEGIIEMTNCEQYSQTAINNAIGTVFVRQAKERGEDIKEEDIAIEAYRVAG